MNTIVEHINSAGFSFVEFAVPMLVQSGILIVILLLADLLLRKKVKAVFRYWIWMLVLVKLVLPTSLSSPLSLGYLFGEKLTYQDLAETTSALEFANPVPTDNSTGISPIYIQPNVYTPPKLPTPSIVEPATAEPVSPPAPVTPLSWQGVVFLVWLAVVIAMGLLLLQRALFVRGLVAQAKKAGRLMNDELAYCCATMKIKCRIGLKVSPNATTPSVCGLIRPVILVPWNLASTLGASRLRTVLMHELAHIKRADLWVNLAQTILQIMYFYNPLLWIANCMIRRIREQAVDEAVLVAMGEKAQKYPQTLVDVAKMAFKRSALSLRLIGVVESKSALAGRIKHILGRPMPKSARLGLISILTIIIAGAVLLPMARAHRRDEPEVSVEASPLDHFVGKYALAGHPDTAAFEITKKGDVFIFSGLDVPKFEMDLFLRGLEGRKFEMEKGRDSLKFGNNPRERYCMRYNAAEDHYILDSLGMRGEVQDATSFQLAEFIKISPKKPDGTFSATLPNGVTVELVGICEHPSKGKQWWRLDGQPIAKPYERLNQDERSRDSKLYEVVYRLFGSEGIRSKIYSNSTIMGHAGSYPLSQKAENLNIRDVDNAYGAILYVKPDAQSIRLEMGAGRDYDWKTLCTQPSPVDKTGTTGTGVVFQPAIEKDGKTYITIAHQIKDGQIHLIAVDYSGQIHESEGFLNTTSNELGSCQVRFNLPADQIKEIQFQTQKFQRVTFKDVSLRPGHNTDVQVEVEESATMRVPEDYPTVYAAVEAAEAGDTIVVGADQYRDEDILIKSNLEIEAEKTISPKLVMLLDVINSCAAETDLNIDSISITTKNISIKGDTSGRTNTRKFLDAVKDNGLNVSSLRLNAADDRDKFSIIVEPKQDWQQWWQQRKTDVQLGFEETVSPKLIMLLVAIKSVASEVDLNIDSISISAKSMSIGGDTSGRTDTLKFLDAVKDNGLQVIQLNLDERNNRDRFRATVEPKENWRQWWQQHKTAVPVEGARLAGSKLMEDVHVIEGLIPTIKLALEGCLGKRPRLPRLLKKSGSGILRGIVKDTADTSHHMAKMFFVPVENWPGKPVFYYLAVVNESFEITGIPPGSYYMFAIEAQNTDSIDAVGLPIDWPRPVTIDADGKVVKVAHVEIEMSTFLSKKARFWNVQGFLRGVGHLNAVNVNAEELGPYGRIVDAGGNPVPYATVQVREFKPNRGAGEGIASPDARTNEQGYYGLRPLDYPYFVGALIHEPLINAAGYRWQYMRRNKIFEGKQAVNFKFDPWPSIKSGGGIIEGTVVDANDNPIPSFIVDMRPAGPLPKVNETGEPWYESWGFRVAFAAGRFALGDIPEGSCNVRIMSHETSAERGVTLGRREVTVSADQTTHLKFQIEDWEKKRRQRTVVTPSRRVSKKESGVKTDVPVEFKVTPVIPPKLGEFPPIVFERIAGDCGANKPLFVDVDTGRIWNPSFSLTPADMQKPVFLPNLACTRQLLDWVRRHGIDVAVQTDGKVIALMGMDMRAGRQLNTVESKSETLTPSDVINCVKLTEDDNDPAVVTFTDTIDSKYLEASYPVITREGGITVLEIAGLTDLRGPNGIRIRYQIVRHPQLSLSSGAGSNVSNVITMVGGILGPFEGFICIDTDKNSLRLRSPDGQQLVVMKDGSLDIWSNGELIGEAARLNTGVIDFDAARGEIHIFGRGCEAVVKLDDGLIRAQWTDGKRSETKEGKSLNILLPEIEIMAYSDDKANEQTGVGLEIKEALEKSRLGWGEAVQTGVPVEAEVEFELITSPLTIKGIELKLSKVATLQYWNEVFDLDSETVSHYEPGTWRWPKGTDIGFDIDMPQEIRDSVFWGINSGYTTTGHRFLALDSYSFEQAVRETSAKLDELRSSKWMGFGLSKHTLPKFPEFFAVLTDGYSLKADSTVEHPSPKLAIIEVVETRDKSAVIKYWLERKTQNKSDVHLEVAQTGGDSEYGSDNIVVIGKGKSTMYSSIQEAIDAAPAGSVVRIGPGVYEERLEINKPLTLEGAGWDQTAIVVENNIADMFEEALSTAQKRIFEAKSEEQRQKLAAEFRAQFEGEMKEKLAAQTHLVRDTENVVIRNLKLTSPGRHIDGKVLSMPVIKFSNAGALLSDCAVVGTPGNGINIEENSDVEIRDSLVAGVWSTGIAVAQGRGNIAKARIINCDVRNCHHRGITIGPGCDSTVVQGCRISGSSWHGIRYDSASPRIIGNLIFANVRFGIYASGRTAADVRRNLFYGNEMSGISCWFKNQDTIEENTFVGNKRSGLEVLGASRPVVRKNIFYSNPTGVFCGDIGDDSASAASDGTVNLEDNLFWGFEHKVAWSHPGDAEDGVVTEEVELDEKARNVVFDPECKDVTTEDFSLKLDSPARRLGIGAADLIDSKSPWPIQDEEIPIIPEGNTEDTSWMGRISSTGKIERPVVLVENKGVVKPQESITGKPKPQEGSEHPGRISGVVINSSTGEPVAGAYVGIGDFGDSGGSNYSRHRSEGFHDKTKTDAEGRFELNGLVFTDKHRDLEYHPLVVTHPDFVRHDEKIELLSGGPVPDVKVSLRPAAKIDVTIVDTDGNPLEGQWLLRLEALDGRRFIPPGSDPHLSSFASNIWAHWPDLRSNMGVSSGFTFTELDTGEYSIDALKFHLVDKPTPQSIWKPIITYHGSIPSLKIEAGQAKQVKLAPKDHQTKLTITAPEFPDKLFDKLERSSQMPLMCLISRSPGALLWDDGRIRHLEDQRFGRIDKERFFRGFFSLGQPLTINNLPPDSYSLFTMAVYGQVAGYLIGARADLAKGDNITLDIPWRQPTGPSMFGPNRSFDYPVKLEARDYSVSQLCEILTEITLSNPRIIADSSIENEKLRFGKSQMSIWDVLEKLYLDNGWRVDEGQDKTLIIKPAEQTDVPVVGELEKDTSAKERIELFGLDLTDAPRKNKSVDLPDLFEARPPGSKSYHRREDIDIVYSGLDGKVYYIPEKEIFYIQHDKLGASTLTYYGPFNGDPHQVLGMEKDVPVDIKGAEAVSGESEVTANQDGPRITFESLVCDLGQIPPNTKHFCEFKFTNTGNEVLKITRFRAPCACTVPELTEKEYAPGESGTLKVMFRASWRAGRITKRVEVCSNDKVNPKLALTIKAEIVMKIVYEPEKLSILLKGENAGCPVITLTSIDNQPFSITGFKSTGDSITADFDPSVKETSLVIQPKADMEKLRKGLRGQIEISLTHPECKKVAIIFDTLAEFKADPRVVYVRNSEPLKPVTKKVWIRSNYNEDVEVESTSTKKGTVKVLAHEKVRNGYQFELQITPPVQEFNKRVFTDVFTVMLKGGQQLQITCYGIYSKKPAKTAVESVPETDIQSDVEEVGEKVSQFIGADLPASVQNVKFHSGNFEMASKSFIRFDIPFSDLKTLLAESDMLPDFSDLHRNPRIQKDMVEVHKDIGIEWWKPDELERPLSSG